MTPSHQQNHAQAKFKFLTRLHYWAADTVTHGARSPWGEHEIDYILFIQGEQDSALNSGPVVSRPTPRMYTYNTYIPMIPPLHIPLPKPQTTAKVRVTPNPEEVQAYKYVTQPELQAMMAEDSGLLWSPWFRCVASGFIYTFRRTHGCVFACVFVLAWQSVNDEPTHDTSNHARTVPNDTMYRIIATRFLPAWWADLPTTLTTAKHVDLRRIHRFDPPAQHMGGGGNAGPYLGDGRKGNGNGALQGDEGKKQGAYGKVKTHAESLLTQLLRVDEVGAALRVKFGKPFPDQEKAIASNEDVAFCFDMLDRVSRSFAAVIRQLPPGLCVETVVFYLVLRALDTVEDDMEAFDSAKTKVGHLRTFYETALEDTTWRMTGVGKVGPWVGRSVCGFGCCRPRCRLLGPPVNLRTKKHPNTPTNPRRATRRASWRSSRAWRASSSRSPPACAR